jgi:Family of unknown function (DUF5906)/Primase C terminal 1 (PriCT-1)
MAKTETSIQTNRTSILPNINDEHVIELALTAGRTDTKLMTELLAWQELRKLLSTPLDMADCTLSEYQAASNSSRSEMKDGTGIVPVRLKDSSLGRKTENIDMVTMIVLDIDCGMSLAEAQKIMAGTESVIHTTFSHTPEHPKLRVIIPLKKAVTSLHAKAIFLQMQERFGGRLDSACFDVARMFYLPRCPKDAESLFRFIHLPGKMLELPEEFVEGEVMPGPSMTRLTTLSVAPTASRVGVGERNSTLTSLVGTWLHDGRSEEDIHELAASWNKGLTEPLSDREVTTTVKSVLKTAERKRVALIAAEDAAVGRLNKEYVFLTQRSLIVRLKDGKIVTKEQMRDRFAGTFVNASDDGSYRKKTAFDAWFKSNKRNELDDFVMAPGEGPIFNNCLNLWRGWGVSPHAGNVKPWKEVVNHLFGEGSEQAKHFEQWVAYPIQHPGTKLSTATVIWSTQQGIGKSLIGATITRLYGEHATTISARELHDQYNGWAKNALFVVGEENSGSDRRADSNRLKNMITGATHHIHEKYQPAIELQNLTNFLFTSNHPDAFHVENDDRRLFIVSANVQPKTREFYDDYAKWMNSEEGPAALMDYLMHLDLTGFNPYGHSPHTSARAEMIEMSKTDAERFAADVFTDDFVDNVIHAEVISLDELTERFNNTTKGQRSNPTAMAKAFRRCAAYSRNRVSTLSGRKMLISIRRHEFWITADKTEWADEYEKGKSGRTGGYLSL